MRPGTLLSFNSAQILQACDCLKLLSILFDLCVEATGGVSRQLAILGTDLHAVGCGGFVGTLKLILLALRPLLPSHSRHQQSSLRWSG